MVGWGEKGRVGERRWWMFWAEGRVRSFGGGCCETVVEDFEGGAERDDREGGEWGDW